MKIPFLALCFFLAPALAPTLLAAPNATPNAPQKTLIILGDSLTEGYGVAKAKAFPALLEEKLQAAGKNWKVVNSGVSGSTSASAASRVDWALKSKPHALFLALGANDGLRGLSPDATKKNLVDAIKKLQAANVKVFLAGMEMPPNFGKEYTDRFRKIFSEAAAETKTPLLPFLLDKVGGQPKLNLEDGIHPNEAGYKIVAETVFTFLKDKL